jgi:hypothetical protein
MMSFLPSIPCGTPASSILLVSSYHTLAKFVSYNPLLSGSLKEELAVVTLGKPYELSEMAYLRYNRVYA